MAIQPIRLFGDPVLRKPAIEVVDFDKELRRLVADLTDTMLEAPGRRPRRAADRRRAAGLHLERRRRGRPPGQPAARPVRGAPGRPRGLPVASPELTFDCRARCRWSPTASTCTASRSPSRARELPGPGDPARDRPPRRRAVRRPARPRGPQGGDEGDPRVRVVRPGAAARSRSPRTPPAGSGSSSDARRLRRHPRGGRCPRSTRSPPPPRAGRRRHPPRRARRPRPQAGRQPGRPSAPRSSACRCSSPSTRATRSSRRRCAALRPGLLPGGRVRRAAAAVGARHPAARLGQPALLGAARLARRRAGAARDLGRRRGHRRDHVPDRQGARRRPDVRRDDRADPARPTPPATCSRGWPRAAPGCWSPPSTASRTARSRPAPQPADGRQPRPEDHRRGRPGRLDRAGRRRSTAGSAPAPRRPAPGRPTTASGSSSARSRPSTDDAARARARSRSPRTPCSSAPAPARSGSARSRRSARSRWPAADWARGVRLETGARFGDADVAPIPSSHDPPGRADDVDEICMALPEVELGTSWGDRPTYKVPRQAGSCSTARPHRTAVDPATGELYDDLLVITHPDRRPRSRRWSRTSGSRSSPSTTSAATTPCWSSSPGSARSTATSSPRSSPTPGREGARSLARKFLDG